MLARQMRQARHALAAAPVGATVGASVGTVTTMALVLEVPFADRSWAQADKSEAQADMGEARAYHSEAWRQMDGRAAGAE